MINSFVIVCPYTVQYFIDVFNVVFSMWCIRYNFYRRQAITEAAKIDEQPLKKWWKSAFLQNPFERRFIHINRLTVLLRPVADVCQMTKVIGPCRAWTTRYFYNADISRCQPFHYGGCDGNGNNFNSREECTKSCAMGDKIVPMERGSAAKLCKLYWNTHFTVRIW